MIIILKKVFAMLYSLQNTRPIGVVLAVILAGCAGGNQTATGPKPSVVASYSVLCDLTKTIAQETIDLTCLIPADRDPHTYSPTPSDRRAIEKAKLILYGGYGFEPRAIEMIESTKTESPKIAVSEKAVTQPLMGEHDHGHDHDHGEKKDEEKVEPDPHVWHDARNTIAMVSVIEQQLAAIAPENAEKYRTNAKALTTRLEKLDSWIKTQIETIPPGKRTLITTHDALGYYVNAYGLESGEALQGISSEESPTASRVKELVGIIKKSQVPTIFAEVTANNKVIETVAREAKVNVSDRAIVADGLGETDGPTGNYIGMMVSNTCAIVDGLGGKCQPDSDR
jgi:manganese/iron transport system substrate-binding protein